MRDEGPHRPGSARRRFGAAIVVTAGAAMLAPADGAAQSLRGYARVQYESQDQRGGTADDLEWWLRTVRFDYATTVRDRLHVTAQAEWNDFSYVDRPDRQVNPRGSLRLAHQHFGTYVSYRPRRLTDAQGVTTRQRETMVTGYLSRPGLPQVQATYVRRLQLRRELAPEQTGTQKTVNAMHTLGAFQLRGAWTHLTRESELAGRSRSTQEDWSGGAGWSYSRARTSVRLSYDGQTSGRKGTSGGVERTTVHAAGANASRAFTARFGSSLTYGYRGSRLSNGDQRRLNDHEGTAALNYQATRAVKATTGGGVRTARIESRLETERYVFASVAAQGRIRPRWTGAAGITRSVNWLPGESSRLVDAANASTQMTIRRGLDLTAHSQVTSGRAPAAVADTSGRRVRVTAQTSLGFTATPLRPVTIRYAWSEYRTGGDLFSPDATARSDQWDARWNPVPSLQFSGTLSRSRSLGPRDPTQTTKQASLQWSPSSTVQLHGSYARSDAAVLGPASQSIRGRETFGLRFVASLLRDWNVQAFLNDVDPGRPSHVRQWNVSVTRDFGR